MPDYNLMVKIGGVYHLSGNLSIHMGLVKNILVVVTGVGPKLIAIHILPADSQTLETGNADILLPRITFKDHLPSGHTLFRRQFPVAPALQETILSYIFLHRTTEAYIGLCRQTLFPEVCFHVPQLSGFHFGLRWDWSHRGRLHTRTTVHSIIRNQALFWYNPTPTHSKPRISNKCNIQRIVDLSYKKHITSPTKLKLQLSSTGAKPSATCSLSIKRIKRNTWSSIIRS